MESPQFNPNDLIEVYELDSRRRNNVEVFLWWYKGSNSLAMTLNDEGENKTYHFDVPNDKGLDALAHPFMYSYLANAQSQPLNNKR